MDRITTNATARAKIVQAEINFLRADLLKCPEHEERSKIAVLASLDSEMAYLMKIPGVAQALFDEGAP
jgi:hypothetical protein